MMEFNLARYVFVNIHVSAGRTYVGIYSMVMVPAFRTPLLTCWPLKDEKAPTSETVTTAAMKKTADFMVSVWC